MSSNYNLILNNNSQYNGLFSGDMNGEIGNLSRITDETDIISAQDFSRGKRIGVILQQLFGKPDTVNTKSHITYKFSVVPSKEINGEYDANFKMFFVYFLAPQAETTTFFTNHGVTYIYNNILTIPEKTNALYDINGASTGGYLRKVEFRVKIRSKPVGSEDTNIEIDGENLDVIPTYSTIIDGRTLPEITINIKILNSKFSALKPNLTGVIIFKPDEMIVNDYGRSGTFGDVDGGLLKQIFSEPFTILNPTFDLNLITTDLSLLDNLSSVALVSDGIPATNISVFQMVVAESLYPTDTASDFGKSGNMYILVPKNAFESTINASYEVIIQDEQYNYYVIGTGTSTNAYTSVNGGAGTSSEDTKFGHYFLLVIDKSILSDVKDPSDDPWNFKIIYETESTYYDITEIFQKNNIVSFDGITQNLYDYKDRFTYIPEERGMLSEPNIVNSYWYIGVKGGGSKKVKMIPT